jgi:hypothetical protein
MRLAICSIGPGLLGVGAGLVRGASIGASLAAGVLGFAICFVGLNIGRRFGVRDLTR